MRDDATIDSLAETAFGEDRKGLPRIRRSTNAFSSQVIRYAGLSGADCMDGSEQTNQQSRRGEYSGGPKWD